LTKNIDPKTMTISRIRAAKSINPAVYSWTMLYFFIPLSLPFTVLFARLGAGPNGATLFRVVISVIALGLLISIEPWIFWTGVILFNFGIALDYVDGDLARTLDRASHAGKSFDGIMDIAVELPLTLVIAVHLWRMGGDPLLFVAAGASAVSIAVVRITAFRSALMDRDVAAASEAGTTGPRRPHPKIKRSLVQLGGLVSYVEGRAYFHVWDLRYGGLVVALLAGWGDAWVFGIAAIDIAMAIIFTPARIMRSFVDGDIGRRCKSAV